MVVHLLAEPHFLLEWDLPSMNPASLDLEWIQRAPSIDWLAANQILLLALSPVCTGRWEPRHNMVGMLAGSLQIPVSEVLKVALISSSNPSPSALPWGSEVCEP